MKPNAFDRVAIHRSPSETNCREHILVLQAAGIAHEVRLEDGEWVIFVPAAAAEQGRMELDAYGRERLEWPAPRLSIPRQAAGWIGVLGFAMIVLLFAVLEQVHAFGFDWMAVGKTNAGRIRNGEWWRTVTALTLHADPGHLLANLIIGGWVGLFVGQSLGSGLAWFSILVAGTLGNFVNAWIRPPHHTSIGSSTAVFAAVGLLAARAWWRRQGLRASWMERWAPLVGGVLLLSFLGTGGDRTDVAAHVLGFLSGAVVGALCGIRSDNVRLSSREQGLFALAALAILALAWALALRSNGR
jgi:membrane associated rhomboid family serine protease